MVMRTLHATEPDRPQQGIAMNLRTSGPDLMWVLMPGSSNGLNLSEAVSATDVEAEGAFVNG